MTEDRKKEIVAVTMQCGSTNPFPRIHKYYVTWFDSNGLKTVPAHVEKELFNELKYTIIAEARGMERSGLGSAETWRYFDEMELLAIFTTDRAKALLDFWADPIDLRAKFFPRVEKTS